MTELKTLFLLFLIVIPLDSLAASIKLGSFSSYEQDDEYLVDADFILILSEEVLDALNHGIPVQINANCEIRIVRNWYPDKTIKTINYVYQLLHQPLTEDYLTVNLKTGLREYYDNLSAALTNIGHLSNIKLINKNTLTENNQYKGRIRMYLDLDSLPAPMRPQVYFSSKWDISSDWHEWVIKE